MWILFQSKHLVLKQTFEVEGEGSTNTKFEADVVGIILMSRKEMRDLEGKVI